MEERPRARESVAPAASGVGTLDTAEPAASLADVRVSSPTGDPLIDGRLDDDGDGDEALLCMGNLPLVGERCVLSDGQVVPP